MKNTRKEKWARHTAMSFSGQARTLITIWNTVSMGKDLRVQKNSFINKPLKPGQFLNWEGNSMERKVSMYLVAKLQ